MTKTYHKIVSATFLLFLTGILALHILIPDETFSQNENRFLQEFPTLNVDTFAGGSFLGGFSENISNDFMQKFETYTTDQFPFRDSWVSMKSWCERLTGKGENNGIYLGADGALIGRVESISPETLSTAAGYLNSLSNRVDVPVYFGLIPSTAEVWKEKLPTGAPTADENAAIQDIYGQLEGVTPLDILSPLSQHSQEAIYYNTDHHWTTLGAYYGYTGVMEGMGMISAPLSKYSPTVASDSFFGTSYSSSGVRWVEADTIYTYVEDTDAITVTSNFTGLAQEGSLYVDSFLEVKDKYSYFLGGNQPLCIIETQHTAAPSVLVVRDSYTDCLAPFLTENFSEIHLLDLRYFNAPVSTYVEMYDIDNVVVLYSVANFVTDVNLFKLGA